MISDPIALRELRDSWVGVRQLRDKVQACLLGSFAQGASFAIHIADITHNLPFIQAFSVLNDVLLQLRDEGHFECSSIFLGALIESIKKKDPGQISRSLEKVLIAVTVLRTMEILFHVVTAGSTLTQLRLSLLHGT